MKLCVCGGGEGERQTFFLPDAATCSILRSSGAPVVSPHLLQRFGFLLPPSYTHSLTSFPFPPSLSHTSACLLPSPPLPFTHTLTHKCRVCFPPALPPSPPDRASLLKVELKGTSHHWSSLQLPKHPL